LLQTNNHKPLIANEGESEINGEKSYEVADLFVRLDSRDDNKWTTVSSDKGTVTKYWKPNAQRWYDCYSFYFIEDDGGGTVFNPWEEITLMGQKFGKEFTDSTTQNWITGSLEMLDVAGKLYKQWCLSGDDKIGYAYLNYYDDPEMSYETNSAEGGGTLTVKFSDTEN